MPFAQEEDISNSQIMVISLIDEQLECIYQLEKLFNEHLRESSLQSNNLSVNKFDKMFRLNEWIQKLYD